MKFTFKIKALLILVIFLITTNILVYNVNLADLNLKDYKEERNKFNLKNAGYWNLTGTPIFIDGDATGVGAHNWTWFEAQLWYGGGNGSWNNPYIIENIYIDGLNSDKCIEIRDSNAHQKLYTI